MRRGIVAAVDDQVFILAVVPQTRRGVGMLAFATPIGRAGNLPDLFPRRFVQGDDPHGAGMEESEIKSLAMQQRCRMHAVLDLELAVAVLGVEPPDLLPLEIEAGEVPSAREGVDLFAVGTRRRRGLVALIIAEACSAGAEPAFPQQPAIG